MKSPRQIFIVDDHPMIRLGLRKLFEDTGRYHVAGEATSAPHALRDLERVPCDGVVMDLLLGGAWRTTLISEIRDRRPRLPIVLYSTLDRTTFDHGTLTADAIAFVHKSDSPKRLLRALDGLFPGSDGDTDPIPRFEALTPRERSVFALLGEGMDKHDIAQALNISVKTVETYRETMKGKLGVSSVARLVRLAVQTKLKK